MARSGPDEGLSAARSCGDAGDDLLARALSPEQHRGPVADAARLGQDVAHAAPMPTSPSARPGHRQGSARRRRTQAGRRSILAQPSAGTSCPSWPGCRPSGRRSIHQDQDGSAPLRRRAWPARGGSPAAAITHRSVSGAQAGGARPDSLHAPASDAPALVGCPG